MLWHCKLCRKLARGKGVLLGGLLSVFSSDAATTNLEKYNELHGLHIEDKWERVKMIFRKDDFGCYHPELQNSVQMLQAGAIGGGFLGGTINYFKCLHDFMEKNDTTLYFDKKEAQRKLVNHATLGFCKGALKTAPYFGLFCGGYTLFSACAEAYRDKQGIIEYTIGGLGIGMLFRFHFGIRGMLSGGIIGGTLGTMCGILYWGLLKITGLERNEVKYAQFSLAKYHEELAQKNQEENVAPQIKDGS